MDDDELVKMAMFKLGEASRRMRALASTAQASGAQRILMAVAQVLAAQQDELAIALEGDLTDAAEGARRSGPSARQQAGAADTRRPKLRLATGRRK
jgi:hypothetical protein